MNHVPAQGPLMRNGFPGHADEPTQQSTAYEKAPKIKHQTPANRSDLIRFTVHLPIMNCQTQRPETLALTCKSRLTMRLSDAGLRRHPAKLIYFNHRLLLGPPKTRSRDRSNRWLDGSLTPKRA